MVRDIYERYAKVKDLDAALKDDCYMLFGKDIIKNGLADKMWWEESTPEG